MLVSRIVEKYLWKNDSDHKRIFTANRHESRRTVIPQDYGSSPLRMSIISYINSVNCTNYDSQTLDFNFIFCLCVYCKLLSWENVIFKIEKMRKTKVASLKYDLLLPALFCHQSLRLLVVIVWICGMYSPTTGWTISNINKWEKQHIVRLLAELPAQNCFFLLFPKNLQIWLRQLFFKGMICKNVPSNIKIHFTYDLICIICNTV